MAKQVYRVIYNQKGGVGKTTLSVNLATCSALCGYRTLLVDSDPQGNASGHLLGVFEPEKTLADFYESALSLQLFRQSLSDFVTTHTAIANLHLVASDRTLEELRNKLENKHKILKLKEGLRNSTYDHVYFDPPPANDFFSLSCLIAATEVIVPIDCDAFSIRAAQEIISTIEEVKADHNPDLKIVGMIVNQYQKGTKHAAGIIEELRKIGLPILEPFIPASVKIRESHSESKPVVLSYPDHAVSLAIMHLFEEIQRKASKEERSRDKGGGVCV